MNPHRVIAATLATSGLAAVCFSLATGWHAPTLWAVAGLILVAIVSEGTSVQIVIGRQGISFTLLDIFVAVALAWSPGAWIPFGIGVGTAIAFCTKLPWFKLAFNVLQYLCAASVAVFVAQLLGGGIGPAAVALVVFVLLNSLQVSVAVAATSGQPWHRVITGISAFVVIHNIGNASVGLLAAWLSFHAPLGLIGLIVPMTLLWWSYRQQAQRTAEARLFEELARGQEKMAKSSVDTSAHVVVTAAARLFGGAEVEMVFRHPDGMVRYVGDEHGVHNRTRVDPDAFGTPWVLRTLASRGILTGLEENRPFCSAVLGKHEQPSAVFIARRPSKAKQFSRSDERLAEVLVAQAESWLSVADLAQRHGTVLGQIEVYGAASRVVGDLGANTVPALTVLQESTDRLSRLAYEFDGPDQVNNIVEELHAVERAVASLLGAIALASDPDLDEFAEPAVNSTSPAQPEQAEWTTTGRFETTELETVESR